MEPGHKMTREGQTSQTGPTLIIYRCTCGAGVTATSVQEAREKIVHV